MLFCGYSLPELFWSKPGTTSGAALEKRLCEFGNILLMIRFVSTSVELTNAHSDVSAESPDAKEPIAILPIG